MKSLLFTFIISTAIWSCSKSGTTIPNSQPLQQPVAYADPNISIQDFKVVQISNSSLQVSFTTQYLKNIQSIEVLSGASENQLCTIYKLPVTANSSALQTYSVTDTNIKGSTMYYMIKFILNNGNWGYTPVYSLKIK